MRGHPVERKRYGLTVFNSYRNKNERERERECERMHTHSHNEKPGSGDTPITTSTLALRSWSLNTILH